MNQQDANIIAATFAAIKPKIHDNNSQSELQQWNYTIESLVETLTDLIPYFNEKVFLTRATY